jgi:hypothetical protein
MEEKKQIVQYIIKKPNAPTFRSHSSLAMFIYNVKGNNTERAIKLSRFER